MIERIKILDSYQNAYTNKYSFIIEFDNHVYKVETVIATLRELNITELVNYLNMFFPELSGDFVITRLN